MARYLPLTQGQTTVRATRIQPTLLQLLLGVALPILSTALYAETLSSPGELKDAPRISSYLFSQEQMRSLYDTGVLQDKTLRLQQECRAEYHVKPVALEILVPIDLPEGKTHPTSGAWRHRFELERCGDTKTYNAIFNAMDGASPQVLPYFPGTTGASVRLIQDALNPVKRAVGALAKAKGIENCSELLVLDMALTQPPREVTRGDGKTSVGVWSEKWTIRACGQPLEIFMEFTPDGNGGTSYAISDQPR